MSQDFWVPVALSFCLKSWVFLPHCLRMCSLCGKMETLLYGS
jgi:hypothetical protein